MANPKRIQLKRIKGWRLAEQSDNPNGVVIVDRRSKWGNPFPVGTKITFGKSGYLRALDNKATEVRVKDQYATGRKLILVKSNRHAVALYREYLAQLAMLPAFDALRGKDLACWCKLCDTHKRGKSFDEQCDDCAACHADVLGELANA